MLIFKKRLIKSFRWGLSLTLLLFLALAGIEKTNDSPPPIENSPAVLYANRCKDDFRKLLIRAVESAEHSIVLFIYSLNDKRIIAALNEKAKKGVSVIVYHDPSTPQEGFVALSSQIYTHPIDCSGLMHKKILIIDEEELWIGSANFTTGSLVFYHNLLIGLKSAQLAQAILDDQSHLSCDSGGQRIDYWSLPEKGRESLIHLKELIEGAKQSIRVAMYTWTHLELTEAIIRAHQRGVSVEVIIDQGQGHGVGANILKKLLREGICVRINNDSRLVHHKFAWIDESILVAGSANWTQAAFKRNRDCLLILHALSDLQNAKMESLWQGLIMRTQIVEKQLLSLAA